MGHIIHYSSSNVINNNIIITDIIITKVTISVWYTDLPGWSSASYTHLEYNTTMEHQKLIGLENCRYSKAYRKVLFQWYSMSQPFTSIYVSPLLFCINSLFHTNAYLYMLEK